MKIATTLIGIEDVTAQETSGKIIAPGRIQFEKDIIPTTANNIYTLIEHFMFKTIEDIETVITKFTTTLKGTIRTECNRTGNHKFNSVDIEKTMNQHLRNKGYIIDFKQAEHIIYIDIIDNHCFIGIPIHLNLQKRPYRIKINNQGINACLAAAMIKLSGYTEGKTLADPFCKDGVILIEAATQAKGNLYGIDTNKNNIRNAIINTKLAKKEVTYHNGDASDLATLTPKKIDCIVSYPPFESKMKKPGLMKRIYEQLFTQAQQHLQGTMIILSPDKKILENSTLPLKEERTIMIGKLTHYLFIWNTVQKD
ncbi:MAG: methyltransferase domain-containing protein [Nanoarchaeota archaeon]|nr:methyltransferase domain-containing protein [Nanoarchaeota archaeon]